MSGRPGRVAPMLLILYPESTRSLPGVSGRPEGLTFAFTTPMPTTYQVGADETIRKGIEQRWYLFQLPCSVYPALSSEKLKAGIFDGPQIRKLIKDEVVASQMAGVEAAAWQPQPQPFVIPLSML